MGSLSPEELHKWGGLVSSLPTYLYQLQLHPHRTEENQCNPIPCWWSRRIPWSIASNVQRDQGETRTAPSQQRSMTMQSALSHYYIQIWNLIEIGQKPNHLFNNLPIKRKVGDFLFQGYLSKIGHGMSSLLSINHKDIQAFPLKTPYIFKREKGALILQNA